MVGQVSPKSVEAIRDRRAVWAAGIVVRPEHKVIDKKLRAPSEQVRQRSAPLVRLAAILLVDAHPGQLVAPPRRFVPAPRKLLLPLEELEPGRQPLLA